MRQSTEVWNNFTIFYMFLDSDPEVHDFIKVFRRWRRWGFSSVLRAFFPSSWTSSARLSCWSSRAPVLCFNLTSAVNVSSVPPTTTTRRLGCPQQWGDSGAHVRVVRVCVFPRPKREHATLGAPQRGGDGSDAAPRADGGRDGCGGGKAPLLKVTDDRHSHQ